MGCSSFKEDSSSEKNNNIYNIPNNFAEYENNDIQNLSLKYYQLLWKIRPTKCFFQLKEKETINKKDINNFNSLLKQKIINDLNNIDYLIKEKLVIFYIHNITGVIITRNKNKINYYLMNYIKQIIDICLVDISNVNLIGGEKFSIYELKNQSKYFFDMNNKEIDFSKRNELINMGKNEEIFEKENYIEDEVLEENKKLLKNKEIIIKISEDDFIKGDNEEKENMIQNNNNKENKEKNNNLMKQKSSKNIQRKTTILKNKNVEKEILNDIETFKPKKNMQKIGVNIKEKINIKPLFNKNSKTKTNKLNINSIKKTINKNKNISKKKEYISMSSGITNINNIEININIINNQNNLNLLSNNLNIKSGNFPLYEITSKTLVIKTYNFTQELNQELSHIFFESNSNITIDKNYYSPYEHLIYNISDDKKKGKKINHNNHSNKNNYIIIHNKNRIPFEQRKCRDNINKIIFDIKEFNIESTYYLKEFIDMIINYKNLTQIKLGQNLNNSSIPNNLIFWKYLKKLFRENFNIRWVSLTSSSLDDNIIDIFLSSLLMKRIRYLNLSKNNLENKAMYFLNKFLIKNQTLSFLYLNNNKNITVEGIKLITNALQMHPNLLKLDISNISLEGCGQFISLLLFENKCLKELNLRNTGLSKTDMNYIASKLIGDKAKLIYLDLGLNQSMDDEGLKEIGRIISNNKSLKFIGLDGLNLTMNNYLPIFEAIIKNRNIESYSLNNNSGLPFKGILNFFLKNQHIKEISIIPWDIEEENEENKFTEDQIYALKKFHYKAPNINIKGIRFE
jgi:hypothetical protein